MRSCRRLKYRLRLQLLLFLTLMLVCPSDAGLARQSTSPQPQAGPRPGRPMVLLTVTVTDGRDGYAWGLDKSAFAVYEDGAPQEIVYFKSKDEPLSVGVLLDVSRSLQNPKDSRTMTWVRDALARFVRLSHASNEYFVVGFNDRPRLLADWTRDPDALLKTFDSLKLEGNTAFRDACLLGIEKIKQGPHQRRVLLVVSDGEDTVSKAKFDEVRRLLGRRDLLVYAIAIGAVDPGALSSFTRPVGQTIPDGMKELTEMAEMTGGRVFYPWRTGDLNAALELIALELRRQYRLGFSPARQAGDGAWHELKVRVTPPPDAPRELKNLSARTRAGYESAATKSAAK